MSIENIDSIGSINLDSDLEGEQDSDWNGRSVSKKERGEEVYYGDQIGLHVLELVCTNPIPKIVLCGENFNGEVVVRGGVDSDGDKNAEVEVTIESKGGNISGSAGGEISQDQEGHVQGRVEVEASFKF